MEYEELKSFVKPAHFFIALKVLLCRNTNEVPIPKYDGSSLADAIWPQETFKNKDELGEALIELLCTDKLLTLPSDEEKKDALVITEKGEKVIMHLFEAIEYACSNGSIENEHITEIPRPYRYYISDFFERSLEMNWSTYASGKEVKYALSEELCMAYYNVFGGAKLIQKNEED